VTRCEYGSNPWHYYNEIDDMMHWTKISAIANGSWYCTISFWVMQCHHPFAIIEDVPLLRIFCMLYATVDVLSATMVSWDVKDIFQVSKANVGKILQVHLLVPLNIISFSLPFFIVVPRKTAYWCWQLDVAKQVFILRCCHSWWERREIIFSHSQFH
jgi:hypothetical protein